MQTRPLPPEEFGEPRKPDDQAVQASAYRLKNEFTQLANDVNAFDGESAKRLNFIAEQLPDRVEQLALLDPYQTIDAVAIEQRAIAHYQYQKGAAWISVLEVLRNALVLVPILLTWIGLSFASSAYAQTLQLHPEKAGMPFLLLWEQGFDGSTFNEFLRFSHIAGIDFGLLVVIIGLTLIFHWYSEVQVTRARKQAIILRQRIEQTLWGLSNVLSQTRAKTPEHLVAKLMQIVNRMEAQHLTLQQVNQSMMGSAGLLQKMFDHFAEERGKFLMTAQEIASRQDAMTQTSAETIAQLGTATTQMQTALQSVSANLSQAVQAASDAASAVKTVETNMTAVVGKLDNVTTDITTVSTNFGQSAHDLRAAVQEASRYNQTLQETTGHMQQLTSATSGIHTTLQGAAQSLRDNANAVGTASTGLLSAAQKLETTSQAMIQTTTGITQVTQELRATAAGIENSNQQLQAMTQVFIHSAQQVTQGFAQSTQQVAQGVHQTAQQTMQTLQQTTAQVLHTLSQIGTQIAQPIQSIFQGNHQAFADINNRILQLHQNVATTDQAIQTQLNHLNTVIAVRKMGGGSNFASRLAQWLTIVFMAVTLTAAVTAGVWNLSGNNLPLTAVSVVVVLVIIGSLALFAWLG